MIMAKGRSKKMVMVNEQDLGYALMELGDAQRAMSQKVYSVTLDRIQHAAKRLRFMLHAEGPEEKK